jgi:hypothetical protein
LDLVPYFLKGSSFKEIISWTPTLTHEEIADVEKYYRENQDDFDAKDRLAREYRAEQIRQQRLRFPEEGRDARLARMKLLFAKASAGLQTGQGGLSPTSAVIGLIYKKSSCFPHVRPKSWHYICLHVTHSRRQFQTLWQLQSQVTQ